MDVVQRSAYLIYDEYAVTAVKLASPFPPVPPEMIDSMKDLTRSDLDPRAIAPVEPLARRDLFAEPVLLEPPAGPAPK